MDRVARKANTDICDVTSIICLNTGNAHNMSLFLRRKDWNTERHLQIELNSIFLNGILHQDQKNIPELFMIQVLNLRYQRESLY